MQSINWIAFGISNTLTKSVVHFLPTSASTNAPYPVNYNITLSSKETGTKSITLDDGRLGQPDGVRLEDIFPFLNEAPAGLMALSIEMATSQHKVDLNASNCVIEIITAVNSVRYFAPAVTKKTDNSFAGMLAASDAYTISSLLMVNCSSQTINPDLLILNSSTEDSPFKHLHIPAIEPQSAYEHAFDDRFFTTLQAQECSWGIFRSNSVSFADKLPDGAVAFAVYRDTLTKRIVSVKAL